MVRYAIVGAGQRGTRYAEWIGTHADRARVTAVAEPRAHQRESLAREHDVPHVFDTWQELAAAPRVADGDGDRVRLHDFLTGETETIDLPRSDPDTGGGHSGGDSGLMNQCTERRLRCTQRTESVVQRTQRTERVVQCVYQGTFGER